MRKVVFHLKNLKLRLQMVQIIKSPNDLVGHKDHPE